MQLLVSVRSADEAEAALAGGADIIDAKEPLNGALGPVSPDIVAAIRAVVGTTLFSVALGDIGTDAIETSAAAAARAGAAFVKIGFAGTYRRPRLADDVRAAADAAGHAALILVAYADHERAHALSPAQVIALADDTRAAGILLDTYDKRHAGLTTLMSPRTLREFVTAARKGHRVVALAGKLSAADIECVLDAGADIAGIRGAACDGDRRGTVTIDRVRSLRNNISQLTGARR